MSLRFAVSASVVVIAVGMMGGAMSGAHAMGSKPNASSSGSSSSVQSDYTAAERAVRAKQYKAAIKRLNGVLSKQPRNVNALNYMGYSYRQLGQYRKALGFYRMALKIQPNHRGANEYLGQLYLKTGNMRGAKAQLARLRRICPSGCEEYDSLRTALRKKGAKI